MFDEPPKGDSSAPKDPKVEKDNRTVKEEMLNHMSDALFDIYCTYKTAKEIWDALELKYGTDDVGFKKYAVCRWLNFKIDDTKPTMDQSYEYENLMADILAEEKITSILE